VQEHLTRALLAVVALTGLAGGCGGKSAGANRDTSAARVDSAVAVSTTKTPAKDSIEALAAVPGITAGGECPNAGESAAADSAAQAAAFIPLKVGLTISNIWKAYEGDIDHECLDQVTAIDARSVVTTGGCTLGLKRRPTHWVRRLCRVDLADSYIYITTSSERHPDTFRGALKFSMSAASLATLKSQGKVRHRYLSLVTRPDNSLVVDMDVDGVLESEGKSTYKLVINDSTIEVPTIEAWHHNDRKGELVRVKVLDDAHFPMMLDYYYPAKHFFVTYTKVSYPREHAIEQRLAVDKRVDVYGIYFDYASDSLRPESTPVLREVATALAAHPEWAITITGHTDSIGGAASNLDLSKRRSATVRRALVEQFKIDGSRLTTNGYGASQPKDVNSTVEGRARNRRVELVRQ